jgi:hypothetical protein
MSLCLKAKKKDFACNLEFFPFYYYIYKLEVIYYNCIVDLNFIPDESENHPEIISILSSEETISADLVGPSRGFAAMPSEDDDEVEDEDDDIGRYSRAGIRLPLSFGFSHI